MHFTYPKNSDGDFRLRKYEQTERITYAFNMRAPGGRYKARFIANSSSCTTTELSKLLTSCLPAVKSRAIRY